MQGWIKLYRQFTEWEWYKNLNTKSLFIHLLLTANITDSKYMGFTVHAGQIITTISRLSTETGLTAMEIRTAMKHLIKTGEISEKVTNKFRIITIVKWEFYQFGCMVANNQLTSNYQSNNSQLTSNYQSNNNQLTSVIKEEEEEKEEKEEQKERMEEDSPSFPLSATLSKSESIGTIPRELVGLDVEALRELKPIWMDAGRLKEWADAYIDALSKR